MGLISVANEERRDPKEDRTLPEMISGKDAAHG
jgi:hypothetical protein